ncbi:hypothetical protein G7061_10315 [Erysipelothrix sp. HDW6B]|uniref:hypothetical protein n=1 Tax=Erysipelothrix sp. HDW6B TaxID=2714929 RepID=UPI0014078762|nr:hypothetical protein [Erysipelothrix sp. HDW6B]QIK86980.1 hypothetical protein G7061_10315 [Erysipelothrix sp. HDW6B]
MIREINQKINAINKKIGVNVTLPKDDNESLRKHAKINGTVATVLLGAGIIFNSKGLLVLSALAGIGTYFTLRESKRD